MPEGPEVKIITETLNTLLANNRLCEFRIMENSRYYCKSPNGYIEFTESLSRTGVTISSIRCKGKFIWWEFSNGWMIWQTLGLNGGWYHTDKQFTGLTLIFYNKQSKPNPVTFLYYNDQCRFGTLKFIKPPNAPQELQLKLQSLGPDMLNNITLVFDTFRCIMRKATVAKKLISDAIVEQRIISGIGNYLRSEILYHAGINPHRLVSSLSDIELKTLYDAIQLKLHDSYMAGGASIQNYSDIHDTHNTHNTHDTHVFEMAVYGKQHDSDGNTIITEKIGKDTQTIYWVAEKQK